MTNTSRWSLISDRLQFPESPFWSQRDNCLYLVEWMGNRVLRMCTGQVEPLFHLPVGSGPSGLCQVPDGSFWVCQFSSREVVQYSIHGERLRAVANYRDAPFKGPCDITEDHRGGVYFTDSGDFEQDWRSGRPVGAIYHLSSDGVLTQLDHDLCYPNGIGLSPDGKMLYVNEHRCNRLLVYRLDADGQILEKRVQNPFDQNCLLEPESCFELGPDGMWVMENGEVWLAHYGGGKLIHTNALGEIIGFLHLPRGRMPTSVAAIPIAPNSADTSRRCTTLYITEAEFGLLYRCEMDVTSSPVSH